MAMNLEYEQSILSLSTSVCSISQELFSSFRNFADGEKRVIRRDASNRHDRKDKEEILGEGGTNEAKVIERSSFVGAGSVDCGTRTRG